MRDELTLEHLRRRLEANLRTWIPSNDTLVGKELSIFDTLVTRRDFLRGTSLGALALMVDGCGSSTQGGPPSTWPEAQDLGEVVGSAEMAQVQQPAGLIVDADVFTSSTTYNPLASFDSSDGASIVGHAMMESYNGHIRTARSINDDFTQTGLKEPDRTYGIPEVVQLQKQSGDYVLAFYEKKVNDSTGLGETLLTLEGTASQTYNGLAATNGNFHNRIRSGKVVCQKMAVIYNRDNILDYNDSSVKPLQLYYQNRTHNLIKPGVLPGESVPDTSGLVMSEINILDGVTFWKKKQTDWHMLDLMDYFKQSESHPFSIYKILEVDTYHDGMNHSFIYGTVLFDHFYSYGFVVTFNDTLSNTPSVQFFAPEFLSVKGDTVSDLRRQFEQTAGVGDNVVEEFTLFASQRFRPFVQSVDENGKVLNEIVFSFYSYDIRTDNPLRFSPYSPFPLDIPDEQFVNRYLISVKTWVPGVVYLLQNYKPSFTLAIDTDTLLVTFDTSTIPTVDIWGTLFGRNARAFSDAYVRSVKTNADEMNVLLVTSFFDGNNMKMGVEHISMTLKHTTGFSQFTLSAPPSKTRTSFEESTFQSDFLDGRTLDYFTAWYGEMDQYLGVPGMSLPEAIDQYQGSFDFYCVQNHQGLLRSYFLVKTTPPDGPASMLIGFNEVGNDLLNDQGDEMLAFQLHDTLQQQIEEGTALHYPPSPIAINPHEMLRWYGVEEDGEAFYTSTREYVTDAATRTLLPNTDLSLRSYMKAACNRYSKSWISHELQKQIPVGADFKDYVLQRDLHQVHLHVTNAYSSTVGVDDDTYVEVRFDKRLTVTDWSNPDKAVRQEVGPLSSIFVKPDAQGRVALEIDIGDEDAKYLGAMMQYRFLSKQSFNHLADKPVALVQAPSAMMVEFLTCNISFRMYDRFSTDNYDTFPVGAPQDVKVKDELLKYDYIDSTIAGDIAGVYGTITSIVAPRNNVLALQADPSDVAFHFHCCRHLRHRVDSWVRHAAHHVISAAEKKLDDARKAAEAALSKISKVVSDIKNDIESGVVDPVVDAVERLANAIEKVINEAVADGKKAIAFVETFWHWLMGSLDFDKAYDIGASLRTLLDNQLKDNGTDNLNKFVKSVDHTLLDKIDNLESKVEDGIDKLFKQSGDYDTTANNGRSDHHNALRHTSRIMHLPDQLNRVLQKLDINKLLKKIDGCSQSDLENAPFIQSLKNAAGAFVDLNNPAQFFYFPGMNKGFTTKDKQGKLNAIKAEASNVFGDVTKFLLGKANYGDIKDNLGKAAGNTAKVVLSEIDTLGKELIPVPGQIMDSLENSGTVAKCIDPDGSVIKDILDLFSLLIFQGRKTFRDIEELGLFLLGELVVLASLLVNALLDKGLQGIEKVKSGFGDFADYVRDHFKDDVNDLATWMQVPSKDDTRYKEISNILKVTSAVVTLVADILDAIALAATSIIALYDSIKEIKNPITSAITGVVFLLRICLKIPGMVIAVLNALQAVGNYETATTDKDKIFYAALLGPVITQVIASLVASIFIIITFFMLALKAFGALGLGTVFNVIAIITFLVYLLFNYAAFSLQVVIKTLLLSVPHPPQPAELATYLGAYLMTFAVNLVLDVIRVVLDVLGLILGFLIVIFAYLQEFDEMVWPAVAEALATVVNFVVKIVDIIAKYIKALAKIEEDFNMVVLTTLSVAGVLMADAEQAGPRPATVTSRA